MTYGAKPGWDQDPLIELDPPPHCDGILFPEFGYAPNNLAYPRGNPFIVWNWYNLLPEVYEYLMVTCLGFTLAYNNVNTVATIRSITYDRDYLNDGEVFETWNVRGIHRKGIDTEFSFGVFRRVTVTFRELVVPA
jgi:hypothetical protein